MSRVMVEQVIPAKPAQPERRVVILQSITCDLCGRTGGQLETHDSSVRWPAYETGFNKVAVTVTLEESNHYPEGGSGTIKSFDCCPACFTARIAPLFRVKGGEQHITEIDY